MSKVKKRLVIVSVVIAIFTIVIVLTGFFKEQITQIFKSASNDEYLAYNGPLYVNVDEINNDGVSKIYLRSGWSKDTIDKTNIGWCLKKGAGLYGLGYTYTGSGEVKDSIIQSKSNAYGNSNAKSTSDANKMKWLFDNMVRFGSDVKAEEKRIYRQNLAELTGIKELTDSSKYSDNAIFEAEQYVLWSYTNNDKDINKPSNNLYKKLKEVADTKGNYTGDGSINEVNNKIKITKQKNYEVTKDGWIGPLDISGNNSKSKISLSNTSGYSNTIYKTKSETDDNKIDLNTYNGTFYIKLNKPLEDNKKYTINFTFKNSTYTTKAWYYTTKHKCIDKQSGYKHNPQPFLMLERTQESVDIPFNVEYENKVDVDLALKKAIVEVKRDGESIYSRYFKDENNNFLGYKDEKNQYTRFFSINSSSLDNGTSTTAEYKMQKSPIKVQKGDIVIYSITIFNEGNIPAIASEITDYLPEGLELDMETDSYPIRYGNTSYTTSSLKTEGHPYGFDVVNGNNTIKIKCLSDKQLISPYDKEKGLMYHSKTVYVRCKVKQDAKGILTNVSEITRYKYKDGDSTKEVTNNSDLTKVLKDRDSKVANWKSPNGTIEYNVSSNRDSVAWRNYSNGKEVTTSFIDYGAQNKDDDDFDKIEVEEQYRVILNKVDSSDKNNKLQGVKFDVSINGKTPSTYETNDKGEIYLPYITLDNKGEESYKEKGIDIYTFEEISMGNNAEYVKIKDKFNLYVRKELKDGINYEVTGYYLRRPNVATHRDPFVMGESKCRLTDENGNTVTVIANYNENDKQISLEIENNKSLGYTLNLEKVDKDDESKKLSGARFTIDGPDGNIQTNTNLTNGELVITNGNVTLNTNYEYTIEETSPETNYENIFDGYKIKVNLYVNSVGKIEESRSNVSVVPKEGTIEDATKLAKALSSIQLIIDSNTNNAKLVIKNDKIVKPMQLLLYKHNNSYGVNGAVFNLYNSDENANQLEKVNTVTTNSQEFIPETKELIKKEGLTIGTTCYYILEEQSVPANYVAIFEKALIKVELGTDKIVKYSIEKVYKDGAWYNYIESDKKVITIDENGKISLENPISYNFNLYKKVYNINKDIIECDPFDGIVNFKVEQIYPSVTEQIKHDGNLINSQLNFENREAKSDSTYKYKITEISVSDNYYNTLVNKPIIVTVRTDKEGNIKGESYEGSNWEFDSTLNLTEEQKLKLSSLIKMKIEGNNINFYIANMPKNYYSLQLVKVDEKGKKIEEKETEFYISQTSTNPDTQGITIGTEEQGKSTNKGILDVVSGLVIESGYTHNYVIKETKEPAGYTKLLGNVEVGVKFTDSGELLDENITCKYIENGAETTLTGLRKVFKNNDIPTIQIYIPNKANLYEFELVKEDFSGNKIEADILENGNIDGPNFNIWLEDVRVIGDTNMPEGTDYERLKGKVYNGILKNGSIAKNIVAYSNLSYRFKIEEIFAKSGYMNILDGYGLIVNIQTNGESKISDVSYQVIDLKDHNKDVTTSFKAKYGEYFNLYKDDVEEKVIFKIKNSIGYKVRLNKQDTIGNNITTATLEAYIEENGRDRRICALNGTYQIEGTNESYQLTGESSHLSEEFIAINPGNTQKWKVYERGVSSPYQNIFEGKYIEVTVHMNDLGVLSVESYTIKNENGLELTQEEIKKLEGYIKQIDFVKVNNKNILNITLKNPFKFKFKLVKTEADENYTPLNGATIKVNGETVIQNGESTYETEFLEIPSYGMKKIEIEEIQSADGHINILDGKKLIINVMINSQGNISDVSYYVQDKTNNQIMGKLYKIFDYISIQPINVSDGKGGLATLEVKIKNPISIIFDLNKVDTKGEPLNDAKFEIVSPIIEEQKGVYFENTSKIGVDSFDFITGTIYGTTQDSRISFEETYVSTGKTYEYKLKETQAPSRQYVNILEDYELFVKVNVAQDGKISIEDYENGRNCIIKNDTKEADAKYYDYVDITIENNIVKVKLQNPNRIKIKLNKKLFGEENVDLDNIKFEINSSNSGKKEFITDYNGNIVIEEDLINLDTIYEYDIKELETLGEGIINILDNHYIKVRIKVKPDGTITTVDKYGVETTNTYEIYKLQDDTNIDFNDTNIDDFVEIDTSKKEDDIPVFNIKVKNLQKYYLKILKQDVDTNDGMNDISFDITVLNEQGEEITLKDANTLNNKDLTNIKTSVINEQKGIIEINDILFEKTGVYTLKIQEKQIDGYKQIPDIYANVYVELINGKYNVTDIKITNR